MRGLRGMIVGLGVAAFACVGCAQREEPAAQPQPEDVEPAASATQPAPAAPQPPAESSLALKRGVVMMAQDRSTFRSCGDKAELWLLDQTDGVLKGAFAAQSQSEPLMLYVEAYGERGPVLDDVAAARAYAGSFVLEEVLYAGLQAEVDGCAAPPPSYIVAARGNEPSWAVEVGESQMLWRQPEAQELALSPVQMQDAEGAVRYHASGSGHQIDLMIDAQACRDPLSGEFFAYAAKAVLDGKELSGCARVGE